MPYDRPNMNVVEEILPSDAVKRLIYYAGDDPDRDGLKDTPMRVLKAYLELFSGYEQEDSIEEMLTRFDTPNGYSEMIVLDNIEFYSTCEHHFLPFFGVAHIGYIPYNSGKVVGISKLARLLEVYARRLQIQERICRQVTDAMTKYLKPIGTACVLEAKHLCISCRGVNKQNSIMKTASMTGAFKEDLNTRQEFYRLIGK